MADPRLHRTLIPYSVRMERGGGARTLATMTEQLSALDATFLELEQSDLGAHMHIGAVLIFEPRAGGPPTVGRLRSHLERRLEGMPRYRQRLSEPTTGGLSWPDWEPAE